MNITLRAYRGFTLIELLVVIAIIAMLATLLFPVGNKVIDSVHETKCSSNLRQLGIIIQTAATDNDGAYPNIENDPQNPIHKPEDGRVWTFPELVKAQGASVDVLKCPADLRAKLFHSKNGDGTTSYFEAKGSSYEWYPLYEGEKTVAPRRFGFGDSPRTFPPSRVRLLMDYAENGEAPHNRSPESSSMHVFYADGSVRTIVLTKEQ
jgi:prepilin-type N-terminal cleavage/methylation domain-containing protein